MSGTWALVCALRPQPIPWAAPVDRRWAGAATMARPSPRGAHRQTTVTCKCRHQGSIRGGRDCRATQEWEAVSPSDLAGWGDLWVEPLTAQ